MQTFQQDLQLGKKNEEVVARDLYYRGLQLLPPPEGKHPFDFYLPDGRSVEIKLDLYSQARSYAAIELPTIKRGANFYIHTTCSYKVYTSQEYEWLFNHGKIPERKGVMGDFNYDGRLVPVKLMKEVGKWGSEWVRQLTQQQ